MEIMKISYVSKERHGDYVMKLTVQKTQKVQNTTKTQKVKKQTVHRNPTGQK